MTKRKLAGKYRRYTISEIAQPHFGKGWLYLRSMGFYSVTGTFRGMGVSDAIQRGP